MTSEELAAEKLLEGFQLDRILNEDARSKSACLLGRFPTQGGSDERAIIQLEKTHFSSAFYETLGVESDGETSRRTALSRCRKLGSNDVYSWLMAWMALPNDEYQGGGQVPDAHVKLTITRPATDAHILKYTEQSKVLITETAQLYADVVGPWIAGQPVERIQWVYNILDKKKEADTILFEQQGTQEGFIIVPDLKWDQITLSSLYLVAIVHDRSLRTMRDLTPDHVPLLRAILQQGQRVAQERFGLGADEECATSNASKLRCFIHYQPTYYHLHVHLLSTDYISHPGSIVGQAHLLQDVIDLLELGVDFKKRTLTYSLGSRSPLLAHLQQHSADNKEADPSPAKVPKIDRKATPA